MQHVAAFPVADEIAVVRCLCSICSWCPCSVLAAVVVVVAYIVVVVVVKGNVFHF